MKILTPVKAIRKHCIDCSGYNLAEVSRCEQDDCPLYPYRMGRNPSRAGKGGRTALELGKYRKFAHPAEKS